MPGPAPWHVLLLVGRSTHARRAYCDFFKRLYHCPTSLRSCRVAQSIARVATTATGTRAEWRAEQQRPANHVHGGGIL